MTASADPPLQHIGDSARTELKDAHTYVFFDDSGRVLASSSKVGVRSGSTASMQWPSAPPRGLARPGTRGKRRSVVARTGA